MTTKSFEVYQVEGMTLKPGTFTGRDGKPTRIDDILVEKVFDNLTGPVPLYFKHDKVNDFIIKGYASKFTYDPTTKQIQYVSHLYDQETQLKVALFDCDKVSPEIDFEGDEDQYTNAWLKGIAFVPNAAIDGTTVKVTPMVFSPPDDEGNNGGKNMVSETEFAEMRVKYENLQKEMEKLQKKYETATTEVSTMKESVATLTGERDLARKDVEKFVQIENDRKKQTVEGLATEVKGFGWNPEDFMEGLDLDQQISMLNNVKKNYLVTKPPVGGDSPGGAGGGGISHDQALQEVIKEMGLSEENIALLGGE